MRHSYFFGLFHLFLQLTSFYPADFDLEGNPDNHSTDVENTLAHHGQAFPVTFPTWISQRYNPGEGRFVSWLGAPGVPVNLEDRKQSTPARLFLFHTPDHENGLGGAVQGDLLRHLNVGEPKATCKNVARRRQHLRAF